MSGMAEVERLEKVAGSRKLLKTSLENSRALAMALDKTGSKLAELDKRLVSIEAAMRPSSSTNCTFASIRDRVSLALGPAVAVLKMLDTIRELDMSIQSASASSCDLSSFLSSIRQLEEALKFLTANCNLAIQWLQGAVEFLEDNSVADDRYVLNVKRSLTILQELKAAGEHTCLSDAYKQLESSFKQILTDDAAVPFDLTAEHAYCKTASTFPVPILHKLQAIVEKLNASNRINKCISIFVEARTLHTRNSLQALDLNYLEKEITEFTDIQDCIDKWSKHLELMVKNVLAHENSLCEEIFGSIASDSDCFSKIALQSGIVSLLQFGMSIAESKKCPTKLLNLLHIFSVLEKLRMDFNKLFGREACIEIKAMTKDLVTKVVNGASEIFWELPTHVELERQTSPPKDGTVPWLVTFVTDYCNQLLGDNYRPMLTQVLKICYGWKHKKYEDGLVTNQIYSIVREIAVNLDSWSKAYEQRPLSYIFMMNNHCHFHSLNGTKLGNIMGDSWLSAHGQYKEYYLALYLRESWGKFLNYLSLQDNPNSASPGSPKKRLKVFNEAFHDMHKKQANWVIFDESLRQKMQKLLVQAFVPAYTSYLQKYGLLVEDNDTVESLENMIGTLFQPKQIKHTSMIDNHFSATKYTNAVTNQLRFTLTAM